MVTLSTGKLVLYVYDQVRLKSAYLASEASQWFDIYDTETRNDIP